MKCVGHVERMGRRETHMILVGKSKGRRPLERPRHRLLNNINMDLGVTGYGGMDWIVPAKARDRWKAPVKAVIKLWVP
jgi:hypothetical protein